MDQSSETPTVILPKLSTVLDMAHRCTCGSTAFFDWGVKILVRESSGKHARFQEYAGNVNVEICAQCNKPVVILAGEMYDASEFISADQVNDLLKYGATREHVTPLRAMDP